jgi:protein arginine N-methyltransferase 1
MSKLDQLESSVLARVAPYRPGRLALFPSVGEYGVYDDASYDGFAASTARNAHYRSAIARTAAGQVVLDVGTGRDALWAVEAARAGAAEVFAIETRPDVAAAARDAVRGAGVADKVTVVAGAAVEVTLPRKARVCVFEIVGTIGGAEGAAAVLADARRRLCLPDVTFLPYRIRTMIAASSLVDVMPGGPYFADEALPYLSAVFRGQGRPNDVRLCLGGPAAEAVISSAATAEWLVPGQDSTAGSVTTELVVSRAAQLDSFLLWVRLECLPGAPALDSLVTPEWSWAPALAPVSAEGVPVRPGDRLRVTFDWQIGPDNVHPDYTLSAIVVGSDARQLRWWSPHRPILFRSSSFYCRLFPTAASHARYPSEPRTVQLTTV